MPHELILQLTIVQFKQRQLHKKIPTMSIMSAVCVCLTDLFEKTVLLNIHHILSFKLVLNTMREATKYM